MVASWVGTPQRIRIRRPVEPLPEFHLSYVFVAPPSRLPAAARTARWANAQRFSSFAHSPRRLQIYDACTNGDVKAVKRGIEQGANLEKLQRGSNTPLWGASWQGQLEVVKVLLAAGAKVNARSPVVRECWCFRCQTVGACVLWRCAAVSAQLTERRALGGNTKRRIAVLHLMLTLRGARLPLCRVCIAVWMHSVVCR